MTRCSCATPRSDHDFVAVAQQENAAAVPKPSSQPQQPPPVHTQQPAFPSGPPFTVYVGNVPYDTAETNLHRFFHPAKVCYIAHTVASITAYCTGQRRSSAATQRHQPRQGRVCRVCRPERRRIRPLSQWGGCWWAPAAHQRRTGPRCVVGHLFRSCHHYNTQIHVAAASTTVVVWTARTSMMPLVHVAPLLHRELWRGQQLWRPSRQCRVQRTQLWRL